MTHSLLRRRSFGFFCAFAPALAMAEVMAPASGRPQATSAAASSSSAGSPSVRFVTTLGSFVVQLDAAHAPKTVDNFVRYVKAGHYDGTVFHRVIPGFMVQGGGMNDQLVEKPTRAPIALESRNGLTNQRGTVSMARRGEPDSATAQFFINVVDNDRLNGETEGQGYAVFGRVVSGMEVVDRIRDVPTADRGPYQNVPVKPVVITSATLLP